jgi:hypothetical protein
MFTLAKLTMVEMILENAAWRDTEISKAESVALISCISQSLVFRLKFDSGYIIYVFVLLAAC